MAKPGRKPKPIEDTWFDFFADQSVTEQELMMKVLTGIHRQARRGRLASIAAPQELLVPDVETMETGTKQ